MRLRVPTKKANQNWLALRADGRIRTGDLILTKDALYLLSYISIRSPRRRFVAVERCNEINYITFARICQYLSTHFFRLFLHLSSGRRFSATGALAPPRRAEQGPSALRQATPQAPFRRDMRQRLSQPSGASVRGAGMLNLRPSSAYSAARLSSMRPSLLGLRFIIRFTLCGR